MKKRLMIQLPVMTSSREISAQNLVAFIFLTSFWTHIFSTSMSGTVAAVLKRVTNIRFMPPTPQTSDKKIKIINSIDFYNKIIKNNPG